MKSIITTNKNGISYRYRVELVCNRPNGAPDLIRVHSRNSQIIREITTRNARRYFGSLEKWVGYAIAQDMSGMC